MKKYCCCLFIILGAYTIPVLGQPVGNTITMVASTDHISVPDNAAWDLAGDFTLSLKVKFAANSWQMLLTHHDGVSTQGFELSYTGTTIRLSPEGFGICIDKPWVAILNTWYTISVSRQGNIFTAFVDGISIGTNTFTGVIGTDDFPLMIGNYYYPGYQFIGEMDDVSIWNSAVSVSQMQSVVAGTLTGNEVGLVAFYNMNRSGQGSGLTVLNGSAAGAVFDGVTVGSASTPYFNMVLPVTFIGISANRISAGIKVDWKVTAESNIRIYEIERSTNGQNFTTAGTVAATANQPVEHNYSWTDIASTAGTVFYRIKGIGLSGYIKYTAIVKVTAGNVKEGFLVSPNPVEDGIINLQFKNQPEGRYTIRLLSATGYIVFTSIAAHAGGNSTRIFNLPKGLNAGVYLVQITAPNAVRTTQALFINNKN
jgi:Concanavalin A-like lectin/glucanases superfamily/Secretion system C-terminal sorting domain